ncbi:hypothetical protein HYDPIDRAFT_30616 [Hydnomerulius pinastri MD-312]|uniref:Uncharacterized protein n=1 Tax=Hydnomerulius pinastri MD-312 TaxID=994086 RepID=A0A0C9V8N9_9AGAM|nr:hypothetical protein HYDPIDRAFT_30616 [Hydnomerulius pinastri MD-312]
MMEKEWTALNTQTRIEGLYMVVHGDVEHYHKSKIFCTLKAVTFIKNILKFELKCFVLKLESWVVGDFESSATTNQQLSHTKLDGLNHITQSKNLAPNKVQMKYDNYKKKIIEAYLVALHHWPLVKRPNNHYEWLSSPQH